MAVVLRLIMIALGALGRVYNGATLWDKIPFLYYNDDEGKKPVKWAAYLVLAAISTLLLPIVDNYEIGKLYAWIVTGVLVYASLFSVFTDGHSAVLIGKANRLPRGDDGIIDWFTEKLFGYKISDMDDGDSRAKNARMAWGVIRYGIWAVPVAIAWGFWLQTPAAALMIPIIALTGVGYRITYAASLEHGETAGHALAGTLFWSSISLAFWLA